MWKITIKLSKRKIKEFLHTLTGITFTQTSKISKLEKTSQNFIRSESTFSFLNMGRLKAHLLYTLYPYNQSIWTRTRNPLWWLFTCPAFIPIFSEIWWCFLYLLRDLDDEYQLIDYDNRESNRLVIFIQIN